MLVKHFIFVKNHSAIAKASGYLSTGSNDCQFSNSSFRDEIDGVIF